MDNKINELEANADKVIPNHKTNELYEISENQNYIYKTGTVSKKNKNHVTDIVSEYIRDDECVVGFGVGGSESLTVFLENSENIKIVRKIVSEKLITPKWDRDGQNVMLAPSLKAKSQARYLTNLPEDVKHYFPRVLNVIDKNLIKEDGKRKINLEYIYDMSYIDGIEISQMVEKYKPSPKNVAMLYCVIFKLLKEKIHSKRRRIPSSNTLDQSYFEKIEKRLFLAQKTAPKTFSDDLIGTEEIVINGKKFRNIKNIIRNIKSKKIYRKILEPRYHSLVMGDTNTENIKIENIDLLLKNYNKETFSKIPFTCDDIKIKFLDPRAIGFHENGVDTEVDDPMYDNKPWHNSLGNYDKIHNEYFDISYRNYKNRPHVLIAFHDENPFSESYNGIEDYFYDSMSEAWGVDDPQSEMSKNDPYWLIRFAFLMGTHFMAMPPFHFVKNEDGSVTDTAEVQRRPLAIYVEGIKWLNIALDMLEGKKQEFLGFKVPLVLSGNDVIKSMDSDIVYKSRDLY